MPFTAAVHRTALLNLTSLTLEKYPKAGLDLTFFSGQVSWYCVRCVVYTHTITNSGKRWEEQHYWDTGKGTSLQLDKVVLEMLPIYSCQNPGTAGTARRHFGICLILLGILKHCLLHFVADYCTELYYFVPYCSVLHHCIHYCRGVQCGVEYSTVLQCAVEYSVLSCRAALPIFPGLGIARRSSPYRLLLGSGCIVSCFPASWESCFPASYNQLQSWEYLWYIILHLDVIRCTKMPCAAILINRNTIYRF